MGMDQQDITDAIAYLNTVGPRSNLGKIRRSVEALKDTAPATEWREAMSALDEADEMCAADSGYEAEDKAGARETLEGCIEDLLSAIEQAEQGTPAVTCDTTGGEACPLHCTHDKDETSDVTEPSDIVPLPAMAEALEAKKLGQLRDYDTDDLRFYQVTKLPAGWPKPHSPVNGHMGGANGSLCPNPPTWRVERTGGDGRPWGHVGYYCDADLFGLNFERPTGTYPYPETQAVTARVCACGCGQPITSPRPEARYATGACRVRAHRQKRIA